MEPSPIEPRAIVPLAAAVQSSAAFASVAGEAALARVVRALLGPGRVPVSGVVVVAAEPLVAGARSCLDAAGLSAVSVIGSGAAASRRACLITGLDFLGREPHSPSHVLVGDHRHPLASVEVTDRVIAGLRAGHRVVLPVLPLTDTVKAVDDRGAVVGTVDRTALRTVQYPRGYQRQALADLIARDGDELTAALSLGLSLVTVEGDADAFAADLPADADLLAAITAARRPG
jgi:2-C-methyl-D-erythritol 4-phosphate cytidylyltransferase